jgi:hypothetical protein
MKQPTPHMKITHLIIALTAASLFTACEQRIEEAEPGETTVERETVVTPAGEAEPTPTTTE